MNLLTPLALVGLLMLAGPALVQAQTEEAPSDQAWVDDCPPDMMCAFGAEDCIECSGPVDEPEKSGDENATDGRVYKNETGEPMLYGEGADGEPCIECSGPAPADGSTCMDGADANETCRDDVMYFGGEPHDTGVTDGRDEEYTGREDCEFCRGEVLDDEAEDVDAATRNTVPGLGALAFLGALAVALVAVRRN